MHPLTHSLLHAPTLSVPALTIRVLLFQCDELPRMDYGGLADHAWPLDHSRLDSAGGPDFRLVCHGRNDLQIRFQVSPDWAAGWSPIFWPFILWHGQLIHSIAISAITVCSWVPSGLKRRLRAITRNQAWFHRVCLFAKLLKWKMSWCLTSVYSFNRSSLLGSMNTALSETLSCH
jgi:hypothetical protein